MTNEKEFKTDAEYYSDSEFVSYSMLKDFLFCQYFFEQKHITGKFKEDGEDRDYFIYGRAVDTLLTEPEKFTERFFPISQRIKIEDEGELATAIEIIRAEIEEKKTDGKSFKTLLTRMERLEEKLSMQKELSGKEQITGTMEGHVKDSVNELLRQPLFKMFGVSDPEKNQQVIALTIDGIKRKGKLDYINTDKKIIADIKTCANLKNFHPSDYAGQLAYYRELSSVKFSIPRDEFDCYLLVVDKYSSYKRSEIFCLGKNHLDMADQENKDTLEKYRAVLSSGFYEPITGRDDAIVNNIRENVCFLCPAYSKCEFSIQKEITYVS